MLVAEALRRQNYHITCVGAADLADPALAGICQDFEWFGWGRLGGTIRYFRRHGIEQATMAGKFHKALLYQPRVWFRHRPDWQGVKTFYHYFVTHKRDNKDDTLLAALTDAFGANGIEFRPATDFAPELLVKSGLIAGRTPSATQQADIEFGWDVAKRMGALDIGQSVCVKDGAILAVEAIEGTDASILRAGDLCKKGDFTVVKVAKPQQDMRFDVPTVGVHSANDARLRRKSAGHRRWPHHLARRGRIPKIRRDAQNLGCRTIRANHGEGRCVAVWTSRPGAFPPKEREEYTGDNGRPPKKPRRRNATSDRFDKGRGRLTSDESFRLALSFGTACGQMADGTVPSQSPASHGIFGLADVCGVVCLVTLSLVVVALLRLTYHDGTHFLTCLNAFTRYVYLPAYACLVWAIWKRRRFLALANLTIVCFHITLVAPDFVRDRRFDSTTNSATTDTAAAPTVRIFFANVCANNAEYAALLREIQDANPDVIVLVEFTPNWRRAYLRVALLRWLSLR